MKKNYFTPLAELMIFKTEDILSASSGENPIIDANGNASTKDPAVDFGELNIDLW